MPILAMLLCIGPMVAQSCSNGQNLADKIYEKGSYYNQAHSMPSNVAAIYKSIYNEIVAENGSGRIGPRYLGIDNKKQSGTVMGNTMRTFVTNPSANSSVEIILEKTDGRAKTGVMVCVYSKNGASRTLPVYEFPNGNGTRTKKFTVNNAKNKIIIVSIKNKSAANKFKYLISAK